jgi:amidase
MAMNSLCSTTAIGLAELIRTRQVSARAVIEAHLERIEQVNPVVNAITAVLADEALAAADLVDRDDAPWARQRSRGSLRVPSHLCGTTALRPTAGRIADAACTEPGIGPISMQLLNCQGPMARNVADLRAAFSILCQPDIRDPRHIPLPADAHGRNIYRVAFVRDPLGMGVEPGVAAGVSLAADWFSDAGLEVVETEPPLLAEAVALWNQLAGADWPSRWQEFEPLSGEALRQCVQAENVRAIDQDEQRQALIARHMIGQAWARFSEAFPVLLAPVCAEPAWPLGDDIRRGEGFPETMRMLLPANALGLPSCAVPVGLANGLPQGVQLIGARFSEMLLLDAAQVIEDRVGPALTPIDPVRR